MCANSRSVSAVLFLVFGVGFVAAFVDRGGDRIFYATNLGEIRGGDGGPPECNPVKSHTCANTLSCISSFGGNPNCGGNCTGACSLNNSVYDSVNASVIYGKNPQNVNCGNQVTGATCQINSQGLGCMCSGGTQGNACTGTTYTTSSSCS
jgi:hypothetical protein